MTRPASRVKFDAFAQQRWTLSDSWRIIRVALIRRVSSSCGPTMKISRHDAIIAVRHSVANTSGEVGIPSTMNRLTWLRHERLLETAASMVIRMSTGGSGSTSNSLAMSLPGWPRSTGLAGRKLDRRSPDRGDRVEGHVQGFLRPGATQAKIHDVMLSVVACEGSATPSVVSPDGGSG